MSRARLVKPEYFTHATLFEAEVESRLPLRIAFAGLWTVADREGRFPWRREVKLKVLPYDAVDFLAVLDALERHGFVRSYEVGGVRVGYIPTFVKHQHFHVKEQPSKLPAPPKTPDIPGASPVQAPDEHQSCTPEIGNRKSEIGEKRGAPRARRPRQPRGAEPPLEPESWPARWAVYWRANVGKATEGAIGAAGKTWVDQWGEARAFASLCEYVEQNAHRPRRVQWWSEDAVRWDREAGEPLVDPDGVLTAKGQRLAGAA